VALILYSNNCFYVKYYKTLSFYTFQIITNFLKYIMADYAEDGFPRKSARTRIGQSTVREKNEESSLVTTRFRSPPPMKYTSPRTSRDCQPRTSSASFNISLAPQRTNRCKRTIYILQYPLHMFAPNRYYF
jgi:hypothetical protein